MCTCEPFMPDSSGMAKTHTCVHRLELQHGSGVVMAHAHQLLETRRQAFHFAAHRKQPDVLTRARQCTTNGPITFQNRIRIPWK